MSVPNFSMSVVPINLSSHPPSLGNAPHISASILPASAAALTFSVSMLDPDTVDEKLLIAVAKVPMSSANLLILDLPKPMRFANPLISSAAVIMMSISASFRHPSIVPSSILFTP